MESIPVVYSKNGSIYWKEDPNCGGFIVSDGDCNLRSSEMELVSYTP
jgi:hypothetical protein